MDPAICWTLHLRAPLIRHSIVWYLCRLSCNVSDGDPPLGHSKDFFDGCLVSVSKQASRVAWCVYWLHKQGDLSLFIWKCVIMKFRWRCLH